MARRVQGHPLMADAFDTAAARLRTAYRDGPVPPLRETLDPARTLGHAGVYSSFLRHTEKASETFMVSTRARSSPKSAAGG